MSRLSITNSLPRTIIRGFKDESGAPLVFEEDALPIHLPLVMGFAAWGPHDELTLVGGSGFKAIFDADSLDHAKPFATHQSEIVNAIVPSGNLFFYRRFLGAGAQIATLRLGVEVVADEIDQFERSANGQYRLDQAGVPIPTAQKEDGFRLRWTLTAVNSDEQGDTFGRAAQRTGTMVSSDGAESKYYPVMDLKARFYGSRGNNLGIRIQAPTLLSAVEINSDDVSDIGAYLYRFFAVKRADAQSTSTVISTRQGEQYVDFSFKEGAVSRQTGRKYFIDDILLEAYESSDPEAFDGYGPFSDVHVYHDNVQEILGQLHPVESAATSLEDQHLINFFTGVGVDGAPYYTIKVEGVSEDGLLFTENSSHFAQGGADGVMGPTKLDELMVAELNAFEDGPIPYMDMAAYPFSCFYDSGFGPEVKRALPALYARPDMYFVAATQVAGKRLNTPSEDSSMAASLRAHYRSVPESEHWGTSACRAIVIANGGELIGSSFKGYLPFTIAFARKCAEYMGSSTGYMNANRRFSSAPGNTITDYKKHNVVFRKEGARSEDWKNGLVFAQSFGLRSIFWPALQSIYDDQTSILNSFFNMAICCNLTRVGERAWRWFTGDDYRSRGEFLRDVREYVEQETLGRYDNRGEVTPNPHYTQLDDVLGYSWHLDITWSGQVARKVETLTIITKRLSSDAQVEA